MNILSNTAASRLWMSRGLLTAGIIAAFAIFVPRELPIEALGHFAELSWWALPTLAAVQLFSISILAGQWTMLLRRSTPTSPVPFTAVFSRYLGAGAVEALTPSAKLGGEAARLYLFRARFGVAAGKLARSAGLQVLGLALGFGVFALAAGAVMAFDEGILHEGLLLVCALGAAAALSVIARGRCLKLLPILTASSTMVWLLYPVKAGLAAWLLGVNVSIPAIVIATFDAYAVGLLPLTPGGLGGYEATMVAVLTASGIPAAQAAAVTLLSRTVSFWLPLTASIPAALSIPWSRGSTADPTTGAKSAAHSHEPQWRTAA